MHARLRTAGAAVVLGAGLLRADSLQTATQSAHGASTTAPSPEALARPETHLADIRMLTDTGDNAEAYFSPDGTRLIFQSWPDPVSCDQMYTMKVDGSDLRRVSNGEGRTTCGFFPRDSTRNLPGPDGGAVYSPDGARIVSGDGIRRPAPRSSPTAGTSSA